MIDPLERMRRRVERYKAGQLKLRWQARQRRHAAGVWFRFRYALAMAERAYLLTEAEAQELLAEGHAPEPVGDELEPPKCVLFLSRERADRLVDAPAVPVRLSRALLQAPRIALVRFADSD